MQMSQELRSEREYTARVQQLLYEVITQSNRHADFQNDTIRMMLSDAWEELRMRPTALSPQDIEQLNTEIDRFLARKSFSENQAERYGKMLLRPFFARVDFAEVGEAGPGAVEKIVIGLYSLTDTDGSLLVHDWRAPVCNLYYDSLPGDASYDSPSGEIRGKLTLKRQYAMENGRLKYYVDTEYSIEDAMLLDILSGATTTHMRNIVATIQKEQNAAIRFEKARVLSVTGGAGSGKTSVAMHRAAYLLHKHRDHLSAKDVVVLSPSDAFTEYISTVLPDLGEENTQTMTLSQLLSKVIGKKVESPLTQYETLLTDAKRRSGVAWLYGAKHVEALDMLLDRYKNFYPHFRTIALDKHVLMPGRELSRMYQTDGVNMNPAQRLSRIQAMLDTRVKEWESSFYPQYEMQFVGSYRGKELEFITRMAVARRLHPVRAQIKQVFEVQPLALYREAMSGTPVYVRLPPRDCTDPLPWENAPGMAYLLVKLGFVRPDTTVKYLLIDEAQDYSEVALRFLSAYFPNASVTLLGDPNQRTLPGLHACKPETWGAMFLEPKAPLLRLDKSYRSTCEITAFCDALLPGEDTPKSFGRSGEAVEVLPYDAKKLTETVARWTEAGYESIAVITRAQSDAALLRPLFPDAHLIEEDDDVAARKGVTLCGCHMTKGLEFDAVAVVWPAAEKREKDERRRLYTACSRALHALALFECEPVAPEKPEGEENEEPTDVPEIDPDQVSATASEKPKRRRKGGMGAPRHAL